MWRVNLKIARDIVRLVDGKDRRISRRIKACRSGFEMELIRVEIGSS
jgi:hypothetical protein